jgi:pimeloyl-ACP methyl ester carboxylesterase
MHNAVPDDDGRWRWRYDLPRRGSGEGDEGTIIPGLDGLWDAIERITVPLTLARGALSPVVDDADCEELRRRNPNAEVVVFEGAGHSIQGDKPIDLANFLRSRLDR